jgi:hypothetical protein
MIRPSGVPLPWRCQSRRLRRGSLRTHHYLEPGCHQQGGTVAAAVHIGLPAVGHSRLPGRSLAVGHNPVVDLRRSLAAVRDLVETGLDSRVCISMYELELNNHGGGH